MQYTPQPIDVERIQVADDLLPMIEILSKNVHETWSQTRIRQGWQYGPQRDDCKLQHPDLIPYENLPEGEKEHDRNSVIVMLKMMLAMGYRIERGDFDSEMECEK